MLEETISGPGWYVASDLYNTDSRCAVLAVLEDISADAPVDFFKQLKIKAPCD